MKNRQISGSPASTKLIAAKMHVSVPSIGVLLPSPTNVETEVAVLFETGLALVLQVTELCPADWVSMSSTTTTGGASTLNKEVTCSY